MRRLIFIVFIIYSSCGCKSQKAISNDNDFKYIVIDVIERKKFKNAILVNLAANKGLAEALRNELHFEENGDYHEFGDLRQIFSDEIIKEVFNTKAIDYLVTQLQNDCYWITTNITGLSIIENKDLLKNSEKKAILKMSYPVFTQDGKYALIKYDSAIYPYNMGNGGILVYKKVKKKWIFINGFLNYFS